MMTIVMLRTLGGPYEQEIRGPWMELRKTDPKFHCVDTTGWLVSEDYVDGIHPKANGHLKLARLFFNELAPILNSFKSGASKL
jgi:hypothetical protein